MSKKNRAKQLSNFKLPDPAFGGSETPSFGRKPSDSKPWFSFRFICTGDYCIKKCSIEQMKGINDRLRILSTLDWKDIESSPRETHGFEMMPVSEIKGQLPADFENEKAIMIFRFGAGRGPRAGRIAGIREGERFTILFIDRDYSLYGH